MDKFVIVRLLGGVKVAVVAERIDRLDLYGVSVRINGELYDMRQCDDVWRDAPRLIEEAFAEAVELLEVAVDSTQVACESGIGLART